MPCPFFGGTAYAIHVIHWNHFLPRRRIGRTKLDGRDAIVLYVYL